MSLTVSDTDRPQPFRILMAADRLVWLARPFRKRPEARKGTDRPQMTRKCRFSSFWVVVTVVDRIQDVFWKLSFRSYMSLENALITQTAGSRYMKPEPPQTKRITPVAQSRTGLSLTDML